MKTMTTLRAAACAALLWTAGAHAGVTVADPWVRATVPAQTASGAFMRLTAGEDTRLTGVSTPAAVRVEIHRMAMDGGAMTMQAVDGIDLPAGREVNLAAGGYHVMLLGLKRQLKAGDTVPLTLVLRPKKGKTGTLTLNVPVRPIDTLAR